MKALIADDHPMVRDALARTLQQIDPELEVLEAADYAGIEAALASGPLALALVDLNMPGMDGVAGVRRLRERYPELRLVVASAERDPAIIRGLLALGVAGYLPKSETAAVLRQGLQLVLAGSTYTPPRALDGWHGGHDGWRESGSGGGGIGSGSGGSHADPSGLTPRQLDVLRLLMRGLPNKQIARELLLTEGTVKIHIAAILRALQVSNRTEAVVAARQRGLGA